MQMSDLSMCIYAITHKASGKKYVGQTRGKVSRRWHAHVRDGRNKSPISASIKEYGKDSFDFEVIAFCETNEQLAHAESFWIKELNTLSPNGYNLRGGGENKKEITSELRKKLSDAAFRRFSDPEQKLLRSASAKKQFSDPILKDRNRKALATSCSTPESREISRKASKLRFSREGEVEKLAKAQREGWAKADKSKASAAAKARQASGAYKSRLRPVILSDGRVFESILACAKAIEGSQGNIGMVLKGTRKSVKGFSVKYYKE